MSAAGENRYDDIINMPHHVSKKHPQMPLADRAAQFSPFAALTGYEAAIAETARVTEERLELSENSREELNVQLQLLKERLPEKPVVEITYFVPDERKAGGSYETVTGVVKKIDEYGQRIVLENGVSVKMGEVVNIEVLSEAFYKK
ncbi:MAG: hypothetical protein J6J86_07365 [Lachnospiraceae bacterium]|nr:hypothetical protein [Lachnospiraceae bacterium]